MKFFVLCLFLGAAAAEAPFSGYPASGWRPEGAQFRLPTEYGAPLVQQKVEVEITKEKVAHAAQIVEKTTEQFLSNEYLPPTTTELPELDPIRVQGLPDNLYKDFQQSNVGQDEEQQQNQEEEQEQQQQPRDQSAPQQAQFKQPFFPLSGQLRALPAKNFQFGRQEQAQPAQTYGVPDKDINNSDEQDLPEDSLPTDAPATEHDDEDNSQSEQATNDGRTVIAVANSVSGQYYILGQDNTLQRVMYATSQSDDDRRNMEFTAQLRYSQVEPIRGPVYAYNEQGQLVRIYK